MNPELLKLLVVDPNAAQVAALRKSLAAEGVDVVGDVGFGPVALTWARTHQPDLVLVAVSEPLARPLETIQLLAQGEHPWTVVALSDHFERNTVRKAVLAGARDILARTMRPPELAAALATARRADLEVRRGDHERPAPPAGAIVTIFSPKGGVGKTTVATNLALALARETTRSVALVDLDLPFGDVALMLDLQPENDLLGALDDAVLNDPERLLNHLTPGPEGLHVLPDPTGDAATLRPEPARVSRLLQQLAALHDFVLVDTPPGLDEMTAAALDVSSLVLLVTTPEVTSLRRTEATLRLMQAWGYSTDKTRVLLNRTSSHTRVSEAEAELAIGVPIAWRLPEDRAAERAAALGQPLVLSQPLTPLAQSIRNVARQVAGLPPESMGSRWGRLRVLHGLMPAALFP